MNDYLNQIQNDCSTRDTIKQSHSNLIQRHTIGCSIEKRFYIERSEIIKSGSVKRISVKIILI